MCKWHNTYDEAYCHLQEHGFNISYDPDCVVTRYPYCCIDKGTGASAGKFLTSYQ